MRSKHFALMAVSLCLATGSILISACGPGQFLGPTLTTTPTVTLTPTPTFTPTSTFTPTPTLTPTITPTPIVYDGVWSGVTSAGKPFSFKVVNNAITSLTVNYGFAQASGSCSVNQQIGFEMDPQAIVKASFGITEDIDSESFAVDGIFASSDTASGTFDLTASKGRCTGKLSQTWTATRK